MNFIINIKMILLNKIFLLLLFFINICKCKNIFQNNKINIYKNIYKN